MSPFPYNPGANGNGVSLGSSWHCRPVLLIKPPLALFQNVRRPTATNNRTVTIMITLHAARTATSPFVSTYQHGSKSAFTPTSTITTPLFQSVHPASAELSKPSASKNTPPPIHLLQGDIRDADSPLRVVNLFTGFTRPSAKSGTGALNEELSGEINRLIDEGEVSGQAGHVSLILNGRHNVMVIGLGRQENWNSEAVTQTAKTMVLTAAEKKILATRHHSSRCRHGRYGAPFLFSLLKRRHQSGQSVPD